jgi:hypothetical protein
VIWLGRPSRRQVFSKVAASAIFLRWGRSFLKFWLTGRKCHAVHLTQCTTRRVAGFAVFVSGVQSRLFCFRLRQLAISKGVARHFAPASQRRKGNEPACRADLLPCLSSFTARRPTPIQFWLVVNSSERQNPLQDCGKADQNHEQL